MASETPSVEGFEIGAQYQRTALHDGYGGNRYTTVAPCADHPYVFLFTKPAREGWGHEFRGDTFLFTGQGSTGDMEMSGGNEAIRDHQQDGRQLHAFDTHDDGEAVTYLGQFEYVDHLWTELPDTEGNEREAIRFKLEPAAQVGTVEWIDV